MGFRFRGLGVSALGFRGFREAAGPGGVPNASKHNRNQFDVGGLND